MPIERLLILGHEATRDIESTRDREFQRLKNVLDVFKSYFALNNAHANPKLYSALKEQEEIDAHAEALKPEDVPEEFAKLDRMGLSELVVEELEEEKPEEVPLPRDMEDALNREGFASFAAAFLTETVDLADVDLDEE